MTEKANETSWPKDIHSLSLADFDQFGLNQDGHLFWNGRPVVTRQILHLAWTEKFVAITVLIVSIFGGLGSAAQGWTNYNDWACRIKPNWPCICSKN